MKYMDPFLVNRHAKLICYMPYSIVICDLRGCTIFFDIISQKARFSEIIIQYKMCFNFSTTLSETFRNLRGTRQDIINLHKNSRKEPIPLVES
jgi:hypothetical protein